MASLSICKPFICILYFACLWVTEIIHYHLEKKRGQWIPLSKTLCDKSLPSWSSIDDDGKVCGWDVSFYPPCHFEPKPSTTRMFRGKSNWPCRRPFSSQVRENFICHERCIEDLSPLYESCLFPSNCERENLFGCSYNTLAMLLYSPVVILIGQKSATMQASSFFNYLTNACLV